MASDQQNLRLSSITVRLISEFDKNYLPSQSDVLGRLLYKTQIDKSTVVDAINVVIKEVRCIWEESSINLIRIDHCHTKLRKLYDSYKEIKKFQDKSKKVVEFFERIPNVFDISEDDTIKILFSLDDGVKKNFLSKPVPYIKNKLLMVNCAEVSGK